MTIKTSKLLLDERPLVILPQLATIIGLNEAIVLQQVKYWLIEVEDGIKKGLYDNHVHDGRVWIYNTYEEWQEQFPFWSKNTIINTIANLEGVLQQAPSRKYPIKTKKIVEPLLLTGNFNKFKPDKTKWYTIDYDALNRLTVKNEAIYQKLVEGLPKVSRAIPETTSETNQNNYNGTFVYPSGKHNSSDLRVIDKDGDNHLTTTKPHTRTVPIGRSSYPVRVDLTNVRDSADLSSRMVTVGITDVQEGIVDAIAYYLSKYQNYKGNSHPNLKIDQLTLVTQNMSTSGDSLGFDLENDDTESWIKIIDHWFNCEPMATDFNIMHFANPEIIENRFYEAVYNTECMGCSQ